MNMNRITPRRPSSDPRSQIISGSVSKTVWMLAWPSVITMLLMTANGLFDAAFVSRLGDAAVSGVGIATQMMNILMAIGMGIGVGSTALVARFIGAKEHDEAKHAVRQSLLLSVVLSIICGGGAYLLAPTILGSLHGTPDVTRQGLVYLNLVFATITPFFLMNVLSSIYRGAGEVIAPLIVMTLATLVAILGDYVLIFGIGPFPKLGIAGAGIATSVSRIVATIFLFAFMPRIGLGISLRDDWRPDMGWFMRILNIGYPAGIQGLLRTLSLTIFYWIVYKLPEATPATAALTSGIRIESLAFFPGFAFSIAATAMVGQNLGARQPDRAEQSAWSAAWQSIFVTSAMGLVFFIFAAPLIRPFVNSPEALRLGILYLQINAISEPFLALNMVLSGAMQGAGETKMPAIATVITQWIFRIPFTYLIAYTLSWGSAGAWVSMSATTVLGGLAMLAVFKRSNWREIQI